MNHFRAFAHQTVAGWHAMIRLPSDAAARPILGDGGKPRVFDCELEAHKEATRHMERYLNGNLVRAGDRVSTAKSAAEALFCFPGKGKAVAVERRRA